MKVLDLIDYCHDPHLTEKQKLYAKTNNGSYMTEKGRFVYSNRDKMSRYLRMFRERILRVFYPTTKFKNVDKRFLGNDYKDRIINYDIIKNFPTKNNIWIALKDHAIILNTKNNTFTYHEYGE